MVCVCRHEGQVEAAMLVREVSERLAGGSDELMARKHSPDGVLITWLVQSFHWDYSCEIKGIYTDQWSGVAVADWKNEVYSVWVECDVVEHGLAAAWKHIADMHELKAALNEDQL